MKPQSIQLYNSLHIRLEAMCLDVFCCMYSGKPFALHLACESKPTLSPTQDGILQSQPHITLHASSPTPEQGCGLVNAKLDEFFWEWCARHWDIIGCRVMWQWPMSVVFGVKNDLSTPV